jgi:hypothetical protein
MPLTSKELALRALDQGRRYPYDEKASDADDWATQAARGVLIDLQDRRGIKHGFLDIDVDVRADIVVALAEIIRAAGETLGGVPAPFVPWQPV